MILVVDASVAVKWFLDIGDGEPDRDRALALLKGVNDESIQLVQPAHFIAEVAAVLAREKPGGANADLLDLMDVEHDTVELSEIYPTALALAIRYRHHLFDTLYHAVALEIPGASLITADRRYYEKATAEGRIILLADWSPA